VDAPQRLAALQAEYFHLQKTVEDFDGKALTIKAWSITFSMAVLVGAFTSHAAVVLLIASSASLLFWALEALWKSFQLGYYHRIDVIEQHFRSPAEEIPRPLQIREAWMERWNATPWAEVWRIAWWAHVALPHLLAAAAGVILYMLSLVGLIRV
jgi:hypothetical protein